MVGITLLFTKCKKADMIEPQIPMQDEATVYITLSTGSNSKIDVTFGNGTASMTFEEGDVIYVACNGKYIGTLTHDGSKFAGNITNPTENEFLFFYFLGNKISVYNSNYSGSFKDWGNNSIDDGYANEWRTLDRMEWWYLLNYRTVNGGKGDGKSYKRATLTLSNNTTVYGLLIFPDTYTGTVSETIGWSEWQSLEAEGVVFLPAAGERSGRSIIFIDDSRGFYWSSSSNVSTEAEYMEFSPSGILPGDNGYISTGRYLGHSVRLVR